MSISNGHTINVMFTTLQKGMNLAGLQAAVNCLPTEEQAVYFGKARLLNRLQFLAGRLLIRQLYCALHPEDACVIKAAPSGKPFLPAQPQWGASITHSGGIVACALNTRGAVGIDAEVIRPVELSVFEPYFLPREWEYIRQHSGPESAFFNLWTRKEAVAKADGRGLGMDFLSIDTLEDIIRPCAQTWACVPLTLSACLEGGYAATLAYASDKHHAAIQIMEITLSELLSSFSTLVRPPNKRSNPNSIAL